MPHAVRCPHCRGLSQVGDAAVGRTVACPNCDARFRAAPLPPPTVARRLPDPAPDLWPDPEGLTGVLLGLALLPLGVPLLWLLGRLTLAAEPVFTFAAPLAVGLGTAGLAVGVGLARGWSHAARVRALLAVAAGGYLVAAGLFFARAEWAAVGRKLFGPTAIDWGTFSPPGGGYTARVPLPPGQVNNPNRKVDLPPDEAARPVPDWPLRAFATAAGQPDDRRRVWAVRFTLADGVPPGLAGPDDVWFAAVRDAVVAASGGELTDERPVPAGGKPGRELRLTLPDRVTRRAVRLVRSGDRLVYAAAEGVFLTADGAEVTHFLGGLKVQ